MRGNLLSLQTQSIVRAEIGVTALTYVALAVGINFHNEDTGSLPLLEVVSLARLLWSDPHSHRTRNTALSTMQRSSVQTCR